MDDAEEKQKKKGKSKGSQPPEILDGKKKAEKIALELSDKVTDLALVRPRDPSEPSGASDAVQALVALGYSFSDADLAVRAALDEGVPETTEELIRRALAG